MCVLVERFSCLLFSVGCDHSVKMVYPFFFIPQEGEGDEDEDDDPDYQPAPVSEALY